MTKTLAAVGDRILNLLAPKTTASACSYPNYCTGVFTSCGGSQCYTYYQCYGHCEVWQGGYGSGQKITQYSGCC